VAERRDDVVADDTDQPRPRRVPQVVPDRQPLLGPGGGSGWVTHVVEGGAEGHQIVRPGEILRGGDFEPDDASLAEPTLRRDNPTPLRQRAIGIVTLLERRTSMWSASASAGGRVCGVVSSSSSCEPIVSASRTRTQPDGVFQVVVKTLVPGS